MTKARGLISENIFLLKYEQEAIIAPLKREDALMLLPTALRKSWICQVLRFIVSWDTSLISNFTGATIMNFILQLVL